MERGHLIAVVTVLVVAGVIVAWTRVSSAKEHDGGLREVKSSLLGLRLKCPKAWKSEEAPSPKDAPKDEQLAVLRFPDVDGAQTLLALTRKEAESGTVDSLEHSKSTLKK